MADPSFLQIIGGGVTGAALTYGLTWWRERRRMKDAYRANIDNPRGDPEAIKAMFDAMIAKIEEHLSWSRRDIDTHNKWIRDEVPPAVEKRREELLAARNLRPGWGIT